jgi:hypothetical protein
VSLYQRSNVNQFHSLIEKLRSWLWGIIKSINRPLSQIDGQVDLPIFSNQFFILSFTKTSDNEEDGERKKKT